MHSNPVRVFVSYSHEDSAYLEAGSLLGYLKGLEEEGVEFWADHRLAAGDLWDEVIKKEVAACDIALVLVSQFFLDSEYCKNIEIRGFLAGFKILVPVILSPCEWERHDWLKSRQFLPGGQKTVEEHYKDQGDLRRLFLDIRVHLRKQIERIRGARTTEPVRPSAAAVAAIPPNPFGQTLAIKNPALFVGRQKELARLRALLQRGSVALLGEPKIGKSSLLWQLARSWPGEIVGPLDFDAIEGLDDYYKDLAERMKLDSPDWRTIRDALRERQLVLLLDELDRAPERGFTEEVLARLRAVSGQNPGFQVVVVSRNPLKSIFPDSGFGSPVYNFLQPFTVDILEDGDARDLLSHPWASDGPSFDASTIDHLLALSERHPFKLQRAAYHRYEALAHPERDWISAWREDMEHML
jgi:hypothetical protein